MSIAESLILQLGIPLEDDPQMRLPLEEKKQPKPFPLTTISDKRLKFSPIRVDGTRSSLPVNGYKVEVAGLTYPLIMHKDLRLDPADDSNMLVDRKGAWVLSEPMTGAMVLGGAAAGADRWDKGNLVRQMEKRAEKVGGAKVDAAIETLMRTLQNGI